MNNYSYDDMNCIIENLGDDPQIGKIYLGNIIAANNIRLLK